MPSAKKIPAKNIRLVDTPRTAGEAPFDVHQMLFKESPDGILVLDPRLNVCDSNPAATQLTGFSSEELIRVGWLGLVPPQSTFENNRTRPIERRFLEQAGTYEDICIKTQEGDLKNVELRVKLDDSRRMTLLMFRDTTERAEIQSRLVEKHVELRNAAAEIEKKNAELKATQDSLVQAGKMAALGELSAGIAHELNQPLQAIKGFSQEVLALLERESQFFKTKAEALSFTKEVVNASDKMSKIIQHLRTFTRKSTEDFEMVDVNQVIEDSLKLSGHQLKNTGVSLEMNLNRKLPKIFANPVQLEQVFINLTSNAKDAIETAKRKDGRLTIETHQDGDFVEVIFRDNGCGMDAKTKTKIFNPFYTTKEVGKGMGLGLSLSYGIMDRNHGSILVESEEGKGSTFTIRIPKDYRNH